MTDNVDLNQLDIAAIVPCYNEEAAIETVIRELREFIPGITVYVYDNNSSDRTSEVARAAGAIVRFEPRKGKGNVVRRAFADVDADIYLLIDGDDTYRISDAPKMIRTLVEENLDHVLGCRVPNQDDDSAYRKGHEQGNRMFNKIVGHLFGEKVTDMLSGYRIFSRRFVKTFPALSREFEIETELTIHTMALRIPQKEISVGFKDRPEGSESKLRTFRDGFRILSLIGRLFAIERPFLFYGFIGGIALLISLVLGIPIIWNYANTGFVPRLPTAVLAASLAIIGVMCGFIGAVLSGILKNRRESARLYYLQYQPVINK